MTSKKTLNSKKFLLDLRNFFKLRTLDIFIARSAKTCLVELCSKAFVDGFIFDRDMVPELQKRGFISRRRVRIFLKIKLLY